MIIQNLSMCTIITFTAQFKHLNKHMNRNVWASVEKILGIWNRILSVGKVNLSFCNKSGVPFPRLYRYSRRICPVSSSSSSLSDQNGGDLPKEKVPWIFLFVHASCFLLGTHFYLLCQILPLENGTFTHWIATLR